MSLGGVSGLQGFFCAALFWIGELLDPGLPAFGPRRSFMRRRFRGQPNEKAPREKAAVLRIHGKRTAFLQAEPSMRVSHANTSCVPCVANSSPYFIFLNTFIV